jgi:gliding motility-associated-like protein
VTDCAGNNTQHTQIVTVQDTTAPTFNGQVPSDITVQCDNVPTPVVLTASDNCDNSVQVVYSETLAGQNDGCSANYVITRNWSVTDCAGNNTQHTQIVTVQDTVAPTFNGQVPGDITVQCDSVPAPVVLTASDNCDNSVSVVYSESFDGQQDGCSANYIITRNWSVTDCAGNNTQHTQIVTVQDTVAPTFNGQLPANVTVQCDSVPAPVVLTASDNCDNSVSVVYSESFDGQQDGCSANYVITRNWSVIDCAGNNTQHTQIVTVQDTTAPIFSGQLPGDITVQCDSVPAPVVLTASDNCDNSVQVVYSETFQGQDDNCVNNYVITRNWSVTDCAGNNTQHTQIVTVQDTTAPTFNGQVPGDITVQCDSVPAPVVLTASDNCDNSVQVAYTESFEGQNDNCGDNYVITRNWSVTDCAGNNTQHTQIVTVQDTTAPTFNGEVPGDITVQCDSVPSPVVLTASDNCDNSVQVAYTETFQGQDDNCVNNYVITRNWSVTDCAGNNTQHTQIVTVQDTTAPTFNGEVPSDVTVQCDTVPAPIVLTASDNCDNSVQVVYTESFEGQNDNCGDNYVITRNWSVTDCAGNNTQHTQIVTVQDITAPTFNGEVPSDVTVQCDNVPAPVVLTASDNCDNSVVVVYTESFSGQDDECSSNYIITRNWSVTDCAGNNTQHIQIVTVIDTTAPVFNGEVPGNITVQCDNIPEPVILVATDNCDNNIQVIYTETFEGQDDGCSANYIITRNWTVTDCAGNITKHIQLVTVEDTTPPLFNGELPGPITVQCDSVPSPVVLTASDNCDNNVQVVYTETFDGQQDNCGANYVITRNWSVTDCAGNNTQHTQIVTVQDTTAPTFNTEGLPGDITVQCDSVPAPVVLTASDNCDNSVQVVYTESFDGQQDNCGANYVITRNWSVTDCAGNNTQHTQIVTVQDTTAPVFNIEGLPGDITVQCDSVPTPVVITASDNCDNTVQVIFNEERRNNEGSCLANYTLIRTWTATDCAGNSVSHIQTINVQDTIAPIPNVEIPPVLNVNCSEIPPVPEIIFTDNCSTNVTVVYTEATTDQTEYGYVIIRHWVVTDQCGNRAEFNQVINVTIDLPFSYVTGSVCNGDAPVDLFSFLPQGTETTGVWVDVNNTGGLSGSILNPAGIPAGFYVYRYTISDGPCPRIIEVYMTIDDDCIVLPCTINDMKISKVVTPGDDGHNDFFRITGLETCGFTYDVKIFNRWGALLYENPNYQNNWSGIADQAISSSNLPAGTYYYIVNIVNSGFDIFNGYFYLGTKN